MKNKRKLGGILLAVGALSILVAVGFYLYNQWDEDRAAKASIQTAQTLLTMIQDHSETPKTPQDTQMPESNQTDEDVADTADAVSADYVIDNDDPFANVMSSIAVGGEEYIGVLSIPQLSLDLPVNGTWSYPKLKISPCRYTGSVEENSLVIAAHNYKKHFGNILDLTYGDTVIFTDINGVEWNYYVETVSTVEATEVNRVVYSKYDLTLFTCTYGGAARVVVRCTRA